MGRKDPTAMIVIGLIAIFFSGWSIYRIEKRKREVYTRFGPVITALEKYRNDTGEYPDSLDKLAPTYLSEIPNCPWRRSYRRYDEVSAYLGHANPQITMTNYAHWLPKSRTPSVSKLANAVFAAFQTLDKEGVGHHKDTSSVEKVALAR